VVEAELCAAAAEALESLGFVDFRIRINHRELLRSILNKAGFAEAQHGPTLVVLDKLDKVGVDGVRQELGAGAAPDALLAFLQQTQTPASIRAWLAGDAAGEAATANLERIVALTAGTPAAGVVSLDLTLARGLSYYTGAIVEIAVPDLAGSLGGGGRYDNLVGMFLGQSVPACGFSLGLERILVVMDERKMFPAALEQGSAADVMVLQWSEEMIGDALVLARALRAPGPDGEPGPRVLLYPEVDKPGKQFKYAETLGVRIAALVGEAEARDGTVTLKDLANRTQVTVPRTAASAEIRRLLN
jgi:histidyl-tRNA synthetase